MEETYISNFLHTPLDPDNLFQVITVSNKSLCNLPVKGVLFLKNMNSCLIVV